MLNINQIENNYKVYWFLLFFFGFDVILVRNRILGMDFVTWFLLSGLVALVIGYFLSGPKNLPPGPRPLPLLGNTRDLQDGSPHLLFYQWAKKYGNVMRIYYGTKMMIVLSGYKVIHGEAWFT